MKQQCHAMALSGFNNGLFGFFAMVLATLFNGMIAGVIGAATDTILPGFFYFIGATCVAIYWINGAVEEAVRQDFRDMISDDGEDHL